MKVGDRVLITSPEHPWNTHTGQVVGVWEEGQNYAVLLDEIQIECMVYNDEAKVLGEDDPFLPSARMPCS